jgi:hypothetical protein
MDAQDVENPPSEGSHAMAGKESRRNRTVLGLKSILDGPKTQV